MIELTTVASFNDEVFPCMEVSSQDANALVRTTYAYREGQHVKSLGRLGTQWTVTAIFGPGFAGEGPYPADLWPHGWFRLRDQLQSKTVGVFQHPMFGRAKAFCASFQAQPISRARESIRVTMQFEESNLDAPTYDLVLGEDAVTEEGAEERAAEIDLALQGIDPDAYAGDVTPFADAWVAYMTTLYKIDRILTADDVTVALNTFHASCTTAIETYPDIMDPINWGMQQDIIFLRRDATVMAERQFATPRKIKEVKIGGERTALQIVVDLYGDDSREAEFLALNGSIINPMIVPPGTYRAYES